MGRADIYPFAEIGRASGEPYPDWIRNLDGHNGVYIVRESRTGIIAYVGESHSHRLYGTLTRHFQIWSPKYRTAGPTYDGEDSDQDHTYSPPRGYNYDISQIIDALFHEFDGTDVPF